MVREFSSGDTINAQRLNCYVSAIDNLCRQVRALQGGQATAYLGKVYHPRVSVGDSYVYLHRVSLNLRQFEYVHIHSCEKSDYAGFTEQVVLCGLVMRASGSGDRTTVKTLAITELFAPLFTRGQGELVVKSDTQTESGGALYVPECVSVLAEKDGGQSWELCKKRICQMPSYFNGSFFYIAPCDLRGRGSYANITNPCGIMDVTIQYQSCRWVTAGTVTSVRHCREIQRTQFRFTLPCANVCYFQAVYGGGMGCAQLIIGASASACLPFCKDAVFETGRGQPVGYDIQFPCGEKEGLYVQSNFSRRFPLAYGYFSANHLRPVVRPFADILSIPNMSVEYYSKVCYPCVCVRQSEIEPLPVAWQCYCSAGSRDPLCNCKVEYVTRQDVYLTTQGFVPDSILHAYQGSIERQGGSE